WLADRYGHPIILFVSLLVVCAHILLVYHFSPYILQELSMMAIISGTLLASLAVFGIPMVILSMVSPFIIGVRAKIGHVGMTAGSIYAVSTAGSILGTFICAFYLVPTLGTKVTLLICFFSLLCVAFFGLLMGHRLAWIAPLLLLLSLIPPADAERKLLARGQQILFDGESKYARLLVLEQPAVKMISVRSGVFGTHSFIFKHRLMTDLYWDYFNIGPLLQPTATRYLLLGGGGGTSVRQLSQFFPQLSIDAVEIDEQMIAIGKRFFELPENNQVSYHIADARPFINNNQQSYDVIGIDLFAGMGTIPFYVATQEFFTKVAHALKPDGSLVMNVFDPAPEKPVLSAVANTLASVFPSVYQLSVKYYSHILFAFPYPITAQEIRQRATAHSLLSHNGPQALARDIADLHLLIDGLTVKLKPVHFRTDRLVLTDDLSPIEQLDYAGKRDFRGALMKRYVGKYTE
ncbi:MAG: fused MFS/spermidine synthase, partial [Planctomycetota bacterium]